MFTEIFKQTGFQATSLSRSIEILNKMIKWRLSDEEIQEDDSDYFKDMKIRQSTRCTIFLGYTSSMASCGMREVIRYLCEHKMVDAIVTTAGGVEEDLIKCLAPTYLGDFELKGSELREKDINRVGNLLIPNANYCMFEEWIMGHLDKMLEIQKQKGKVWTPSRIIKYLGRAIDHKESIYYWAAKNKIPVFCPALTDGSMGNMFFFHFYKKPGLVIDIIEDIIRLNKIAIMAKKSGMIILGGGVIKHHINNANMMRNGGDYAVYINTACEFDGSDSGAKCDEAVSWGKIKIEAESVKIYSEISLVLPIIVAETFYKNKDMASKLCELKEKKKKINK
jgi:deoxyhypusine synthase